MTPETSYDVEFDAQDRAEVLDETNLTEDGEAIANFDSIQDVYDATSAEGDDDVDDLEDDDDEDFDADEDPDAVDDELRAARDDEGLDIEAEPRSFASADSGRNADNPDSVDSDDDADAVEDDADPHVDRQLDKGLKETFPASDPVSINPGAD